jgi:hypothetical protein
VVKIVNEMVKRLRFGGEIRPIYAMSNELKMYNV